MRKLTQKEGIKLLDDIEYLFGLEKFNGCINEIKKIKNELNGSKDFVALNNSFRVLQTTFAVEYSKTPHRIRCCDFYKRRINLTLKTNISGLNNVNLDLSWAKMIQQRTKSRIVLLILDKILHKGTKTDEEKGISISYLYLACFDGTYGKNLKEILIFDKLANMKNVKPIKILNMKMHGIKTYFQPIPNSQYLFEGWDNHVRNAVAHSSFWYEKKKKKMIFEDRTAKVTVEKTTDELYDMIVSLSDVDILIFYFNQIFRVNKVIFDLK